MSIFGSFEISASGLTAERLRMDVISNNLANVNTTRTPSGGPYRREHVVLEERYKNDGFGSFLNNAMGDGVEVVSVQPDNTPLKKVYDPGNPDAGKDGYVLMPNVEPVMEMVDLISATRAYEAGVSAIDSAKQMQSSALSIGKA
jgi:flagellar basal-body rod protein FlgC